MDRVPTADVQEVRHGKWIKDNFNNTICSECKQYTIENEDGYPIVELKEYKPFYCPNCGAKMDADSALTNIYNCETCKNLCCDSNYPCLHCISCERNTSCEQGIKKWLESEAESEN